MARFAVGDIHGCSRTFKNLVEVGFKLTKADTLYLLGDLVNKGPDSKGVLDYVFKLKKEGYQVVSVRGNHDQMFLDAYYGKSAHYWTTEHAEPKTLKSFKVNSVEQIPIHYFDFVKEMPYYLELDDCFLVHAGFNFSMGNPFLDLRAMMHLRKIDFQPKQLNGKKLIHGHVPTAIDSVRETVNNLSLEVNIDGGCVYYLNDDLGYLAGLNLDTMELFTQENIDKPYPIDIKK